MPLAPPTNTRAAHATDDGWLEYNMFYDADGFDAFLGDFSVPDVPSAQPQVLYLFTGAPRGRACSVALLAGCVAGRVCVCVSSSSAPGHHTCGDANVFFHCERVSADYAVMLCSVLLLLLAGLQNIDWIPKVDPFPTTPFDIIQPVLQFPADDGDGWSVKSWYVTLNSGAVYSNEMNVSPGDAIFGNMTRTGAEKWFIGSTSVKHGTSTTISADHPRLKTQPWAYNTLECYGCQGCSTYPQQPCKFTKLQLFKTGMKPVTPTWKNNPKPAQDRKCHESIAVEGPATVTIGFQS